MGFKILSIGEFLWDMLPAGRQVGGAPANFAYQSAQLGADVRLVTRVGDDPLGKELLDFYRNLGISTELMQIDGDAPTGTVDVELRPDGQPVYTINEHVAWDRMEATDAALRWASESDAVCFGSLAARSEQNRKTLRALLDVVPVTSLRVLDLNLRNPFCDKGNIEFVLSSANVLKLNDEELVRVADLFALEGRTIEQRLRELIRRYRFRLVILTCGADGSWLTTESTQIFTPGIKVQVTDTVGAGDAFTAASILGFLGSRPLEDIGRSATELAAYVCTCHGGTPPIPRRFLI